MSAALEESVTVGQRVTVYSLPVCPQCKMTYKTLDRAGVDYDVVDISSDPQTEAFVKSFGYVQAPVVFAGDRHWSGFRPDMIASLVEVAA